MGKRIFCSSANCRNVSLVRPNKVFLWSAACRWWDLLVTAGRCGAEKGSIVPADKGAQTGEEGRRGPRGLGLCVPQAVCGSPRAARAALSAPYSTAVKWCCRSSLFLGSKGYRRRRERLKAAFGSTWEMLVLTIALTETARRCPASPGLWALPMWSLGELFSCWRSPSPCQTRVTCSRNAAKMISFSEQSLGPPGVTRLLGRGGG